MPGGLNSIHQSDPAKKEAWLNEMASRPKIELNDLLSMYSAELISKIDKEQRGRFVNSVPELLGFTALDGATKDEQRLIEIAKRNMAEYDDLEDIIYEDLILASITSPEERRKYANNESFTEATRLRRTVVAHYLAQINFELISQDQTNILSKPA